MKRIWSIKAEEGIIVKAGSNEQRAVVSNTELASFLEDCDPELSSEMLELEENPSARHEVMQWMNAGIDKSPAILHQKDKSKLRIPLRNIYGSELSTGANEEYDRLPNHRNPIDSILIYHQDVDFSDREEIRCLNRWRDAVLKHYLGTGHDQEPQVWHPMENECLMQAHAEMEIRKLGVHPKFGRELPSWAGITYSFNAEFEGRVLPGSSEPRRPRSQNELKEQWNLIAQRLRSEQEPSVRSSQKDNENAIDLDLFGTDNR